MDRERESSSSSSAAATAAPVGFRPWALILLFSLLILLVLPSSFRGFRPFAIRNGWDTLNILLVLFAILCGVLSRRHGTDDGDRLPRQVDHGDWRRAHSSYPHLGEAAPEAGGLRMRSGGGSYPVLRPTLDAAAEEWRFYSDVEHYRQGSESGVWERERLGDSEAKMIAVDAYAERSSPLARSRSPFSLPPPTQRLMESRALYELPEGQVKKGEIFEPEAPHPPSPPQPPQCQSRMTRRRRAEKVAEEKEVEKNEIFGQENNHSLSSSPSPTPRQRQPRRRSIEKFRERDVGQNAKCEPKTTDIPLPEPAKSRHQRRRSVGDVPQWEVEQNPNVLVEKPPTSPLDPSPSPPEHQEEAEEEEELVEKTNHKKRRSGGAKDIAAAIALLYPKKKGSKTKKSSNDTAVVSAEPASSAAPPPPPLPSSVFHHLFYQKKGGNKARQIHSESAAPPPPPPMPPPPEQQSTQQAIQPPVPAPAPPSLNRHHKGKEKVYLYESPLSPPPARPSRLEKSNLSKPTLQASSSMSPIPPRSPPPRRPSHSHQTVADEEVAANHDLNRRVIEGQAMKLKERENAAVSCPSPDVDNKADLFIARCHANWKLEKQNSMREKERRKQQRRQESELRRV
ncbi:serine/arginine repetitive matrix protein 1-like [Zingiber officinale]|uniref:Hydroxyproline-rich glycoprotein family protein n=1 Tax=Zingiber officinale TaxID=94328 RepID=A0A8J5GBX8_ZINOF|nr:serine/arginine repetitive matrix protein 1-like [Zingiber officinale]KAG6505248.1 hypothetical protein ZIOFF_037602 [Zingiber officinale]